LNTSIYIARRYLFSKKSVNAINMISGISVLGVFVGSAALIIILSVFNGLEKLVLSMYNTFTPEIRIEPAKGKTFNANTVYFKSLSSDGRIASYTETLEEKALIRYGSAQFIGMVKGVSGNYMQSRDIDTSMLQGSFTLRQNGQYFASIGSAVQTYLSVNVNDISLLQIYSPRKGGGNAINPADEFIVRTIKPSGVFEVQKQFDEMVLVPIEFSRELLGDEQGVSAIEINVKDQRNADALHDEISEKLGQGYLVKNRRQQDQALYKTLNIEKWAVFLILTFVLIIATFNIIGSLTMLVIDKRKDIAILSSIGADKNLIRNIFFTEGMLIAMIGCVSGMVVGFIFCLLQEKYGFVTMGAASMIADAYPVDIKWRDFVLVFFTVTIISSLASYISSRLSVKHIADLKSQL
jgi:lipoprotein-releasing system permease protein